jgi:hypothetical protein
LDFLIDLRGVWGIFISFPSRMKGTWRWSHPSFEGPESYTPFNIRGEEIRIGKRVRNHREREEELQIDESQRLFKKGGR